MRAFYITNSFAHTGGGLVGAVSGLVHGVGSLGLDTAISAYEEGNVSAAWDGLSLRPLRSSKLMGMHFGGDLQRELEEFSPDLVHAHGLWLRTSQANWKWCKHSQIPYVISPHGMLDPWAVCNSKWKKRIAGLWFEYAHLNDAACLHALCLSEADSIRKFNQKNPVCIIPNGIHLPGEPAEEPIAPWDGLHDRKALLFVGRLHPKKGLPLLLSAWAKLKKTTPSLSDSWFMAIAGWSEAGHREELEAQAKELGIENDIEFLGILHGVNKAAALHAADAFVLPSYSEGLPMSVLEAWAYHLPVLMTPECNLPEGFDTGSAIRCETSAESICISLRTLVEMSDAERSRIGDCGYDLVQDRFVWRKIAKQMNAVYEWVLGGGEAPECLERYS